MKPAKTDRSGSRQAPAVRAEVAIAECGSYDPAEVTSALERALAAAGGLDSVVKRGDRVFVKPNHLGEHPIELAINTHPAVLGAVCEALLELGARVVVGDGLTKPGDGPFRTSGIYDACKKLDVELVNLRGTDYARVEIPGGTVDAVHFSRLALDSDLIITMPKLKTHVLTQFTGAVKNSYGFLPDKLRATLHRRFIEPKRFSAVVVDVFSVKAPALAVMDAVVALEGEGPSRGGRPKEMGLLLASRDCVALDAVSTALAGFEPAEISTTRIAAERGLGVGDLDDIDVVGTPMAEALSPGFARPKSIEGVRAMLDAAPAFVTKALGKVLELSKEFPVVVRDACIGCGLCERHCPAGAVKITNGKAVIDYALCISCFCCQEFCESDAIKVGRTRTGQTILNIFQTFKRVSHAMRSGKKQV